MVNFSHFLEEHDEERFLKFIRRGLELRPDSKGGRTFWDDFSDLVSSNPDLAADFFEIPRSKVSRLKGQISSIVQKVQDEDRTNRGKNTII